MGKKLAFVFVGFIGIAVAGVVNVFKIRIGVGKVAQNRAVLY